MTLKGTPAKKGWAFGFFVDVIGKFGYLTFGEKGKNL